MTFGEKIKNTREEKKLSQRALGEKMGVTQQTIAQYEKIQDTPKLSTIRKIAEALDIPMSDLIDDWKEFSQEEVENDISTIVKKATTEKELDTAEEMIDVLEKRYESKYSLDVRLYASYELLNKKGKEKAVNYVEDLSKITEYQNLEEIDKLARKL